MSKKSTRAKLEFVLNMINNIEKIIANHGSIEKTIKDVEGQNAVLMCILQIGEKINNIDDTEIKSKLPVKEANSVRNFIAHDYDGIDFAIIADIIKKDIPNLKLKLEGFLKIKH